MKGTWDLSEISPEETRDLAADYVRDLFPLDPTEKLVSAVWSMSVAKTETGATVDAAPSSRLSGGSTISANLAGDADMAAVQRVAGCVDGNTYLVKCLATTTRGQVLDLHGDLRCRVAK
jgi:hypothetical protein